MSLLEFSWPMAGAPRLPDLSFYALRYREPAPLQDVPGSVRSALDALPDARGRTVGIGVGSRGIGRMAEVLQAVVDVLSERGAKPLLVPAMGSHGGGTPEGRRAVLQDLGLLREEWPWDFDATPVAVGESDGEPLLWPKPLAEADAVLAVNRVKPHPSFEGRLMSGCAKMLVVGMGGPEGAGSFHRSDPAELSLRLERRTSALLATGRVLGGVAVLEGAGKTLVRIAPVRPDAFIEDEARLLDEARALMATLPLRAADVLIVGSLGKNISGTGVDTRVVGRTGIPGLSYAFAPEIRRVVALDLHRASHGNANGMGLVDMTTEAFFRKIDFPATYLNVLTATFIDRARLPLVFPTETAAVAAAFATLAPPPDRPVAAVIEDTSHLGLIHVSEAALDRLTSPPDDVSGPFTLGLDPLRFDPGRP